MITNYEILAAQIDSGRSFKSLPYTFHAQGACSDGRPVGAGQSYSPLSASKALIIKSSDVDDDGDPAGNGAQTVRVFYIDANQDLAYEDLTLNGTTDVNTSSMFTPLHFIVTAAGASTVNEGIITIQDGSTIVNEMAAQTCASQVAIMAIPRNYEYRISNLFLSAAGSTSFNFVWRAFTSAPFRIFSIPFGATSPGAVSTPVDLTFPAGHLYVSTTGAGGAVCGMTATGQFQRA